MQVWRPIGSWALGGFDSYFVVVSPVLLLLIPIVISAKNWLAAIVAFLGLAALLAIPESVNLLLPGYGALALGFSVLVLVWPRMAISLVCFLIMIPMAAMGAGMIGSWSVWRN